MQRGSHALRCHRFQVATIQQLLDQPLLSLAGEPGRKPQPSLPLYQDG